VRVLGEHGDALGVMSSYEAINLAFSKGLDLVEISPKSKPPVCKIVDFGKYQYEKQKKEKLAKKNQSVMVVKEIRFNANTDTHDTEFKTKHLRQFLMEGHKVKASILYKGRMITHPEIGRKLMAEVLESLKDVGKVESPPKMEGKMLITYLVPDKARIASLKSKVDKVKPEQTEPTETKAPQVDIAPQVGIEPQVEIENKPKEEDINAEN
jgi:translation initiation factor IF-3